jgi:hypothetical protein
MFHGLPIFGVTFGATIGATNLEKIGIDFQAVKCQV